MHICLLPAPASLQCVAYGLTGGSGGTSSTLPYREYCSKVISIAMLLACWLPQQSSWSALWRAFIGLTKNHPSVSAFLCTFPDAVR